MLPNAPDQGISGLPFPLSYLLDAFLRREPEKLKNMTERYLQRVCKYEKEELTSGYKAALCHRPC
jgi:hypothetical protein